MVWWIYHVLKINIKKKKSECIVFGRRSESTLKLLNIYVETIIRHVMVRNQVFQPRDSDSNPKMVNFSE